MAEPHVNMSPGDGAPVPEPVKAVATEAAAAKEDGSRPDGNGNLSTTENPCASSKAEADKKSNGDNIDNGITTTVLSTLEYDPATIARYIHYYKTGEDINNPPPPTIITTTDTTEGNKEPPKKKQKQRKKKHIPPEVQKTRRTIQLCCRDHNLPLALETFHAAMRNLIKMEAQVFYQLLNLCEGTFAESRGGGGAGTRGVVHVGTPKNPKLTVDNESKEKEDGGAADNDVVEEEKKEADANNAEGGNDGKETKTAAPPASTSTTSTSTFKKSSNITTITLEQRLHHAHSIHALLSAINVPLIEQAFTALVRLASRARDYERAERYLTQAEGTQQCKVKLRLYSSLLRSYCGELDDNADNDGGKGKAEDAKKNVSVTQEGLVKALQVWKRMHDNSGGISSGKPNKKKDEEEVAAALARATASNDTAASRSLFGEGVLPKITLTELEYSALLSCATKLHDVPVVGRIMSDVADRIPVPGIKTTEVILNWFRRDKGDFAQDASSALDHVALPPRQDPPLGSETNPNGKGWNIHRGCTIDTSSGELTLTTTTPDSSKDEGGSSAVKPPDAQYRLKPVELTDRAWKAMREMNSSIVLDGSVEGNLSRYQGGGKGKKRARGDNNNNNGNNNQKQQNRSQRKNKGDNSHNHSNGGKSQGRINAWKKFESFLENHPPYNVVIDGANVGYYEQNFQNSPRHVDYNQIDWLLRHLLNKQDQQQEQNRIILFMHERHFSRNLAPHWAFDIFKSWDGNEGPYDRLTVYRTPGGMNDDWYWMHAALVNGGKEGVPSVLAVTNDEMRDHHFQMLADDSFLRWKERHQVYFDFGHFNQKLGRRGVFLTYPKKYSRRIQRVDCGGGGPDVAGEAIVIPLPKRGDEGRFADGVHVAEDGVPEEETYTVIQRVV